MTNLTNFMGIDAIDSDSFLTDDQWTLSTYGIVPNLT
jgi:hypothetical protein